MENKVKVWGKEIDNCISCNYCSAYEPRCLFADLDLWEGGLHKDCPFSKPITKEIIEEFGYKLVDEDDGQFYFENKEEPGYKYIIIFREKCSILDPNLLIKWMIDTKVVKSSGDIFTGTVYNSIELEFILKSIGVIE